MRIIEAKYIKQLHILSKIQRYIRENSSPLGVQSHKLGRQTTEYNERWKVRLQGGKNRVHGNLGEKEFISGCGRLGKASRIKLNIKYLSINYLKNILKNLKGI